MKRESYEEQAIRRGWEVGTGVWEYLHAHPEVVVELLALPDDRHETIRPLAERTRCRIHELGIARRHYREHGCLPLNHADRMRRSLERLEEIRRRERTLARMRGEL